MAETVIIRLVATDSQNADSDPAMATITVNAPAPPEQLVPEIISLTADDTTLDPAQTTKVRVVGRNYDRVVWSVSGGTLVQDPDSTDEERQQFTAPSSVIAGTTYTVTVTLSNDHGSDTENLTLTINNVAPIITNLTGIPQAPSSVQVGGSFTATVEASDPNGDNLAYSWSAPGFTQNVGMLSTERDFTAPALITSASNARRSIVCTARDIPPAPYVALSDSRQQEVIISPRVPDPPIIDRVNVTQSTVEVEWREASDTGGGPITAYQVSLRIDDSTNFTRTVNLGPTARSYTYENLAADTPHEVSVVALNTFDIDGNSYGGISTMARMNARTQAIVIVEPDDNEPPELMAEPDDNALLVIHEYEQINTPPFSTVLEVSFSDPDGDEVTISWEFLTATSNFTMILTPRPQTDAFAGDASALVFIGASELTRVMNGIGFVKCTATDEHGETAELQFSIRFGPES